MMPYAHGLDGNSSVSGSRVPVLAIHVYVNWRKFSIAFLVRALTSPTNMRKPFGVVSPPSLASSEVWGLGYVREEWTHGLEGCDF